MLDVVSFSFLFFFFEGGGGNVDCWDTFIGFLKCCLSYSIAQRNFVNVWIGRCLGSKGLRVLLECDTLQNLIPLLR